MSGEPWYAIKESFCVRFLRHRDLMVSYVFVVFKPHFRNDMQRQGKFRREKACGRQLVNYSFEPWAEPQTQTNG